MHACARIAVFSLTLLVVLVSQIAPSFAPYSPSKIIASSGTIVAAMPKTMLKHLVVYPYSFTSESASFVASHFDIVAFDFSATKNYQLIKAANPNVIMIAYVDFMFTNTGSEGWNEVNLHEDWFLHDTNGNRLIGSGSSFIGYAMDVGNSGWRSHYANYVKAKLEANPTADGIFADNVWEWYDYRSDSFTVPRSLVPTEIQQRWHNDMIGMLQYVKSVIGNKLLVINSNEYSGDYIKYCDGQMIEGFMHPQWNGLYDYSWNNPISDIGILETLSASGKLVMAQSGANIPQNPSASDIEQTHKVMLYCLSGFLMGYSGKANFGFQFLHSDYTGQRSYWEEMDAPIGTPVGAKYNIQGSLWARDFTNGKAYINISDNTSYTVSVEGTNYTIPPRSGLIIPT